MSVCLFLLYLFLVCIVLGVRARGRVNISVSLWLKKLTIFYIVIKILLNANNNVASYCIVCVVLNLLHLTETNISTSLR